MNEPTESDMEKFREDLREKRERNVLLQDQPFDPSPIEKLLLFAVVALTIAVIVLGVKLSNVGDSGDSGDSPIAHEHPYIDHVHQGYAPADHYHSSSGSYADYYHTHDEYADDYHFHFTSCSGTTYGPGIMYSVSNHTHQFNC